MAREIATSRVGTSVPTIGENSLLGRLQGTKATEPLERVKRHEMERSLFVRRQVRFRPLEDRVAHIVSPASWIEDRN
jgi:hypothetical protein